MTGDLLERLSGILGVARELRCDGDAGGVPPGWTVARQGPGDLGAKLGRALSEAAADGVERLVIVGADAPLLPLPLVEAAFAASDLVLAPAEDGGFVLIGANPGRVHPETLFRGVPWGTAGVFRAVRENAAGAGLRVLPGHWDVDRPEDLDRLRRELPREGRLAAFFRAYRIP